MSSGIVLSAGVRQNLLSLQQTAALAATTENRLATGKKVNSALDNPQSFFTSQSLLNRSTDLGSLLDQIGQAQQTLQAANQGLTSLTNLVQSAKSLANQALQATKGTISYSSITGTGTIAADTTQVTSSATYAAAAANISTSVQANFTATDANVTALAANATVDVTINGESYTFTKVANGADASAGSFTTGSDFAAAINHANAFGTTGQAVAVNAAGTTTVTSNDVTSNFTIVSTLTTVNTAATTGDSLTVNDGTNTATFYKVASGASTAGHTYSSLANLVTTINASTAGSGGGGGVTASGPSTSLVLASSGSITLGGNAGASLGFATSAYNGNYNSTLAGVASNSVTVQVGSNAAHTVTFGSGSGQIATKAALNTALAGYGDISGSVNSSGKVVLTSTSTDNVTIGGSGSALTALGLTATTTTPTATVVTADSTRSNLQTQYNNLLTQIDQLASDSSYNGINLLHGDSLKVTFNETGTSSLTIQGVTFNSQGLGLSSVSGNGFQDNTNINTTINSLNSALTSLRTQAAAFGSTLSTVQTRQDFTKNLVNVLQTGSDNLVLADSNQEGANLLALQTRQQLSTTALSLANQASQAVLRLFG